MNCRDAFHVLEPYFEELKDQYLKEGLSRVKGTVLRCSEEMHDSERHFAGCLESGKVIFVAPQLVDLPPATVMGILAHELGHAADFLYPGEWLLRFDHVRRVQPDKHTLKGWKKRADHDVEVTADMIAKYVLGVPIGYLGPCKLQSLGAVAPRPIGLR